MKMEELRKKNCTIIILDEQNKEVVRFVEELIINEGWISFSTKGNLITIPINRVIKIKEEQNDKM